MNASTNLTTTITIPSPVPLWNDRNVFMTYDHKQSHPSPFGMRRYESLDPFSPTFGTDVFVNHNEIDVPDSPCFSGDRVLSYEYIIHLRKHICA